MLSTGIEPLQSALNKSDVVELHNEHYTSISFHTNFMLTDILLIKCILIIHNTLLHIALLWGAEGLQSSQKQPEDKLFFFCSSICCYPALMALPQPGTTITNITAQLFNFYDAVYIIFIQPEPSATANDLPHVT